MAEQSLKVPFFKAAITNEEENLVLEVLKSGWITTGKYTKQFENDFSAIMNSANDENTQKARNILNLSNDEVFSLAVNSATSGMILALQAFGIKKGDAVITTPYTFVSTAACAKELGAEVLFADTEKDSYSIDVKKIEELLEKNKKVKNPKKIKTIIPVHIAGNLCNMQKIMALAKKYGVYVIEDAAHSFPSKSDLGYAGSIADAGVFSFYVTKTITTAEGGMIVTRNKDALKKMQILRMHGMDRTTWDRYTSPRASWEYDIVELGHKFNIPDLLSALGVCQLKKAFDFLEKRKTIVQKYNESFKNLDFVTLPPDGKGNAYHLYLLKLNLEKLIINRDEFANLLQQNGIGISVHFIPLFHFTYWKNLNKNFISENFPNAENNYIRTISLPLWPEMNDEMIQTVIKTVTKIGTEHHA